MAVKTFTQAEQLTAADTNTYLANGGLVYVTSKTWTSTTAAQQVDNCFSSTYDDYRLIFSGTSNQSTPTSVQFQLVDGTTPDTAANYFNLEVNSTNAAGPTRYWNPSSSINYVGWVADGRGQFVLDLCAPALVAYTTGYSNAVVDGSAAYYQGNFGISKRTNTAYEGFKLTPGTGTWAGTVTVFGYRKA